MLYDITGLLIIGSLILSAIITLSLAGYGWRYRSYPLTAPYIVLMIISSVWSIDYAIELVTSVLSYKIFLHNLRMIFIPFLSVAELWLVLLITGREKWLRPELFVPLSVIPVNTALLAVTTPLHPLLRYNFSVDLTGILPILQFTDGWWYQLYIIFMYGTFFFSCLLLLMGRSETNKFYQIQKWLVLFALLFPLVGSLIFEAGVSSIRGFNPAPSLLGISGIIYAIAIYRYGFLGFVPIARSSIIESLQTPMFILDSRSRLVDLNPAAERLFQITQPSCIGMKMDEIAPDWPDLLSFLGHPGQYTRDLLYGSRDGRWFFEAIHSDLRSGSGLVTGEIIILNDKTYQKKLEDELKQSEEKYRLLFDNAPIGIGMISSSGRILEVNRYTETITGFTRDELIEKDLPDLYAPHKPHREILEPAENNGPVQGYEIWMMRRDGVSFPCLIDDFPVQTDTGYTHFITLRDITERRKAERELQESESFNRGLVENLPDYVVVYNREGRILYANPACGEALGYHPSEMVNMPVIEFLSEEDREMVKKTMDNRFQGHSHMVYEIGIYTRNREKRTVLVKGTQIWYGNTVTILLLLVDITERKEMETTLRENEEKFISIFHETPDPILILDPSFRVIEVNRGFENAFGYIRQIVTGKNIGTLELGLDQSTLKELADGLISPGQITHTEMNLKNRSGQPFIADVAITRISIRTQPCLLIAVHDIDEISRAHRAIAEINRKLRLLSSITRHDILNRIMVTSYYSEIIRDTLPPGEIQKWFEAINQASSEIQTLIEFTGQYQEIGSSAPVWQVLSSILRTRQIQELTRGVHLTFSPDQYEIYADQMLVKVIYNLVENSIRHGTNLKTIRISMHEDQGDLVIWYEDDGGGIATGEKKKIFEKGFGKNTGLGLFLIQEILSITGISITETGEPGIGVRFEMRVPAGKFRPRQIVS